MSKTFHILERFLVIPFRKSVKPKNQLQYKTYETYPISSNPDNDHIYGRPDDRLDDNG